MFILQRWWLRWRWPRKRLLQLCLTSGYLPGEQRAIDEQYEMHVTPMESDKYSDCGGWTWDPPCGGCDRCISMQISYYAEKAKERRIRMAALGLIVTREPIPWVSDYHIGVQACATWSAPNDVVKARVAKKKELGLL